MRVIWTSSAHVWRLRSLFPGTGYDNLRVATISLLNLPTLLFRWIWGWKSGIPAGSRRRLLGRPLLRSMPVKALLTLSYRCIDVIFFGPKGHFVINKYLYYWTWNLFIILLLYVWMKHPRHTYGGFIPSISEQGMTVGEGEEWTGGEGERRELVVLH
jgi:hypothetical protein